MNSRAASLGMRHNPGRELNLSVTRSNFPNLPGKVSSPDSPCSGSWLCRPHPPLGARENHMILANGDAGSRSLRAEVTCVESLGLGALETWPPSPGSTWIRAPHLKYFRVPIPQLKTEVSLTNSNHHTGKLFRFNGSIQHPGGTRTACGAGACGQMLTAPVASQVTGHVKASSIV